MTEEGSRECWAAMGMPLGEYVMESPPLNSGRIEVHGGTN